MGSAHHAKALKAAGTDVRGMISLEMLGYYDDAEGSQEYPIPAMAEIYPKAGNFLALVGRPEDQAWITHVNTALSANMKLPLETLAAPRELEGVDFSDHLNYWDAGFTAMMLTDTAHLRNPHYHEKSDTADTLNYDNMAEIVNGLRAVIFALDKD
jgi:Zn-dependent M28 family amino/carboxypeptidase